MTVIMSRLCNGGFFIIWKYKHSLTKMKDFTESQNSASALAFCEVVYFCTTLIGHIMIKINVTQIMWYAY